MRRNRWLKEIREELRSAATAATASVTGEAERLQSAVATGRCFRWDLGTRRKQRRSEHQRRGRVAQGLESRDFT